MPVPSAQEIRKPLLEAFRGEAPHNYVINEILELIAENLGVRLEEMSSTEKTAFKNNINDAKNFLRKYKLLSHPSKTTYMITRAGAEVLEDNPEVIDDDYFTTPKKIEEKEEKIEEVVQEPAATQEPEIMPEIVEESLPVPETEPEPEIVEEQIEEQIEEAPVQEPEPELEEEAEVEVEELESEAQESDSEIPVDFAEQEFDDAPEEVMNEEQEAEFEEVEDTEEEIEAESEENESEENFALDDDPLDKETYEEPEESPELVEEDEEMTQEPEPEVIEQEEPTLEPEQEIEQIEQDPEEVTTMNEDEIENEIANPETVEENEISNGDASNEIQNIEDAIAKYNDKLADEVLEKLATIHQDNFCMMVMDLLSKMGYRVFQSARYTNEAEGSDLIHGVILENKPGMNPIYIQARKLSPSRTIGKADMQDFIDALVDKGGKGMFVTTGTFSEQAEVAANDERIMLVDGKKLAGLMIANNFCVSVEKMFELKAIDTEGFSDYEN